MPKLDQPPDSAPPASLPEIESLAPEATHGVGFRVEGWDSLPGRVHVHVVLGEYFQALGLRILAGRALTGDDRAGIAEIIPHDLADPRAGECRP